MEQIRSHFELTNLKDSDSECFIDNFQLYANQEMTILPGNNSMKLNHTV